MSLDEKLGQLIMPAHTDLEQSMELVKSIHVGGFWFAKGEAKQTSTELNSLQQTSKYPLLISADFEKGAGTHVDGATDLPINMSLGASRDTSLAYRAAKLTAQEARALGVHVNFAPVVDVNNNPKNPIINIRSFGEDPKLVADMAVEAIRGYQDNGLLATAKHFPGHGNTSVDSHSRLGAIETGSKQFESVEIFPYARALEKTQLAAIMTAHLWVQALDKDTIPATLSHNVLSEYLRRKMGFSGIIFPDAMVMGAITSHYSIDEVSVQVIQAGCDILLWPGNPKTAFEALKEAVNRGTISEERVNESVRRILRAKTLVGLHRNRLVDTSQIVLTVGTDRNYAEAKQISGQCITLVKDDLKLLPLKPAQKILVLTLGTRSRNAMITRNLFSFPSDMRKINPDILTFELPESYTEADVNRALELSSGIERVVVAAYVRVIVGMGTVELPNPQRAFMDRLLSKNPNTTLVSFGNPYIAVSFPNLSTYVCAFDNAKALQEVTAEALYGKSEFRGKLPVTISDRMRFGDGMTTK